MSDIFIFLAFLALLWATSCPKSKSPSDQDLAQMAEDRKRMRDNYSDATTRFEP